MLEFVLNIESERYELNYADHIFSLDMYPGDLDLFFDNERICTFQYNNRTCRLIDDSKRNCKRQMKVFFEENSITLNHLDVIVAVEFVLTMLKRSMDENESESDSETKGIGAALVKSPSNESLLRQLGSLMQDSFDIIRTVNSDFYYFDPDKNYYSLMDFNLYGYLIQEKIGVNLPDKYCKTSLSSIKGIVEDNVNLWEFADKMYLDASSTKNYGVVQMDDSQLTSRKFVDKDGNLLQYDPNVNLDNGENATLMERTLRQIFIPRTEPENDKTFKDILYLIGESFIIGNISKNIVCLFNPYGNNGKTLYDHIEHLILGSAYRQIEPKTFKDPFYKTWIDDSNAIIIDEVLPDSLKNYYHQLKNLTKGGDDPQGLRKMHSDQYHKSRGFGVFYILCNELLDIDLHDEALLHRFLIYDLPNRFIENADENSNEYEINLDIFEEITNDTAGIEWLVNIAIKMYQTYKFDRQSTEYVKDKIITENVIRRFIVDETSLFVKQCDDRNADDYMSKDTYLDEILTTTEIKELLLVRYPFLENWSTKKLLKRIGIEVANKYGDVRLKNYTGLGTAYMIKYTGGSTVLV